MTTTALAAGSDSPAPKPEAPADPVRRRLSPLVAAGDRWSWLVAGVVTGLAAIIRLVNLTSPPQIIFDETHYAPSAYGMLRHGVEWQVREGGATPVDGAPVLGETGAYVVHPPLGKWLIGLGEAGFGYTPFGWRIAAAVAGIASVLMITRIARRLFGSTVLGAAAGLLVAVDGMHVVMSRTAMLDIFLLFFLVAAFGAMLLDRDATRARWRAAAADGLLRAPPAVPWWRLAAGGLLGCALAVKWSAVFFIPVFVLLVTAWEIGARRSAGLARPRLETLLTESHRTLAALAAVPVVYLASWTGWFVTGDGFHRNDPVDVQHTGVLGWVYGSLENLVAYHLQALDFHSGLDAEHPYQSDPWQWLLLARPVAFHWVGEGPCGAESCASSVLLLGTPLLWWSFLPAAAALVWFGTARRDWRAPAILLPAAAGILPWFYFDDRVMFYFYALPAEPFLVLAVVYVLGVMVTRERRELRIAGTVLAAAYVLLVALTFAYFYPIYTGQSIPYEAWQARMWIEGWI